MAVSLALGLVLALGVTGGAHPARAATTITITMPSSPSAQVINARYSTQDVWNGILSGAPLGTGGVSVYSRLQALNPPNFRVHAGTDGGYPGAGGLVPVMLPFNAPYTSSDGISVPAWSFTSLNAVLAESIGRSSGSPMLNVRYLPDNMYTGTGPLGGNGSAQGTFADPTYQAYATYMVNLVKYYNKGIAPPGANPASPPGGLGPITYWEIYNEPDYASENPRIPPVLPTPTGITLQGVTVTGGVLTPGSTYTYEVAGISTGDGAGHTLPSTPVSVTLTAGQNAVQVNIPRGASTGLGKVAPGYAIYGRASGSPRYIGFAGRDSNGGSNLVWVDKGTATPSGTPPASNTTGGEAPFDPLEYKKMWDVVVPAMKAVDPTIKVVGPIPTNPVSIAGPSVVTTAATYSPSDQGWFDTRDYVQVLMTSANKPDVVSYHGYGGFQGNADSDATMFNQIGAWKADITGNILAYTGNTPLWQTEIQSNAASGDPTHREAGPMGAAWLASAYAQLAALSPNIQNLYEFMFVESDTLGIVAESGTTVPGAHTSDPYLSYWPIYWINQNFTAGSRILPVTGAPAGVDVLAVAQPPTFTHVKAMVVNRQVPATNSTFTLQLAGATVTAATTHLIDSTTSLVNGPSATSLGAVNSANLAMNGYSVAFVDFDTPAATAPDLAIAKSHTGNFTAGDTGDTYTVTVRNVGTQATSGTVSVVDTLPAGLTATGISGTGWSCVLGTLTCTRSDALAAGNSYPPITVTVNVAPNAATPLTNTVVVSGGGDTNAANNTANDVTVINRPATPDLTIAKSHTGNFAAGDVGDVYTLTVSNVGSGPSSGTVSVVDALPAGLTATAISGTGWSCTLGTLTCTRSGALAGGGSYPPITVTVNVAANAPAQVTNTATVSGGGDSNGANNTASDPTTINQPPDLTVTKSHSGFFVQGQTGATYTLAVSNIGQLPTTGTVTLTDTLPAGLTATAMSGSGWTCVLATVTCTRSDALAGGASYPAVSLVVDVAGNAPATVTNTATVAGGGELNTANDTASDLTRIHVPATLSASGFTGTEGTAATNPVASFSGMTCPCTATIDWGDGTTSAGTVSGGTVNGTHTYGDEGIFTMTVTVSDRTSFSLSASAPVTINEGDLLSGSAQPVAAVEGALFNGPVATFTDVLASTPASDFLATISWGDGTSSLGTVSGASGSFTVIGSHVYAEEGTYPVSVKVTDDGAGTASLTLTTSAKVADAPLSGSLAPLNPTAGAALNNVLVATFVDGNKEALGNYSATINWGDGTTTQGTLTDPPGTIYVYGSHTYATAGTYTVTVTMTHAGAVAAATAAGIVSVAAPTPATVGPAKPPPVLPAALVLAGLVAVIAAAAWPRRRRRA